mmetsp:Transcript_6935/g.14475  ORF Transcript_6935/g.14475 Transcript_6935/m.14475 type:complete len:437 (-) Transcript_6935:3-1313(-)
MLNYDGKSSDQTDDCDLRVQPLSLFDSTEENQKSNIHCDAASSSSTSTQSHSYHSHSEGNEFMYGVDRSLSGPSTEGTEELEECRSDDDAQLDLSNDEPECLVSLGGKTDNSRTDEKYINGRIRTVGTDPDFLESFFRNSRLSYIGSFKQRKTRRLPSPSSKKKSTGERFVFHVDMDCFFAAVVLRNFPQYKNRPVAISHHGKNAEGQHTISHKDSTSECATCNYEARKFGIKKGMFLGRAKELCPDLVVLKYDFDGYKEVSSTVSDILHAVATKYNGVVEEVSCDESYMELHLEGEGSENAHQVAAKVAGSIRADIFESTQCTATVGVATNKFLAKLSTDRVKPDGLFVAHDHQELLRSLKLRDLHGIGYRSEPKLAEIGLLSVQDVWDRNDSLSQLKDVLGEQLGKKIWLFCQGKDDRPVEVAARKTIGAEVSL